MINHLSPTSPPAPRRAYRVYSGFSWSFALARADYTTLSLSLPTRVSEKLPFNFSLPLICVSQKRCHWAKIPKGQQPTFGSHLVQLNVIIVCIRLARCVREFVAFSLNETVEQWGLWSCKSLQMLRTVAVKVYFLSSKQVWNKKYFKTKASLYHDEW